MKYLIAILLLFTYTLSFANHHEDDENLIEKPIFTELPTMDVRFVEKIGILTLDEIIMILGEPAKRIELKMKSSNDVIARTWYYHNINTDENGKTTYGPKTYTNDVEINMCNHWTSSPDDEVDPAFVSLTAD